MKSRSHIAKQFLIGTCAILFTGLAGLALLLVLGTLQHHTGWIEAGSPSSVRNGSFSYESQLSTASKIFRGSDLFTLGKPQIISRDDIILQQNWDLRKPRGLVRFTTSRRLENSERLAVEYSLRPHFAKIFPALVAVLALLSSAFAFLKLQQTDNILLSLHAARAIRLLPILAFATLAWWIVGHPGWTYGDDHFILASAVQGEPLPATVFPELGRFFPLGLIDINLLVPFGNNPIAYHLERVTLLGLTILVLYLLTTRVADVAIGSLLVLVFLTTPSLLFIYGDSIFPESLLLFLLSLFFLLYLRGSQADHGWTLIGSGAVACAATYCKEPVFGMLCVFAGVNLLFGWRKLGRKTLLLNFFLMGNGLIFLATYACFCATGGNYADNINLGTGLTRSEVLLGFCGHPWFVFAALLGGFRAFWLVAHGDRSLVIFDAMLFAGLSYVLAFVLLRLTADYYLLPAYVCWTASFAGYLGSLFLTNGTTNGCQQSAVRPGIQRLLPLSLGILALIGSFQLPDSIKSLGYIAQTRVETRAMSKLFVDLRAQGFELFVYFPAEMAGHAEQVHQWRCHVVNVFDSNLRGETGKRQDLGRTPFQKLDFNDLPLRTAKSIVIHDPAYSVEGLNQLHSRDEILQVVDNAPYVMGANLYTQTAWLDDIKQAVDANLQR